jgi:hypothetical protein
MRKLQLVITAVLVIAGALLASDVGVCSMQTDAGLTIWAVDPLVKVLPSARPPENAPALVSIDAVRNEYESAQIVVVSDRRIEKLTVKVGDVAGAAGPKPSVKANFVGFVHVEKGTPETPPEHLAFTAPVDAPDPLLALRSVSVDAGRAQPIWLTVYVPEYTHAGTYSTTVEVAADGQSVSVPLFIHVHKVTLPDERTLKITNWFFPEIMARVHGLTRWSEPHWKMLETYAQFMGEHRQNVALTPIMELIKRGPDVKGRRTFDFTDFDRWVELLRKYGIDTVEGGGIGQSVESDRSQYEVNPIGVASDLVMDGKPARLDSDQFRRFASEFFPALQRHLEAKGWLAGYVQHLSDEPSSINAEAYKKFAACAKKYAPKIRIIEACLTKEVAGAVDIWVTQPQHYQEFTGFLKQSQRAGDEVWSYTCCGPRGEFMNRFIDYPLLDVRLLHWANYKYSLPGYLHWGYNFWRGDPFKDLERDWVDGVFLPAGDTHIIYPGPYGPLSSIRLEAMRDGIEDFELLKILARTRPAKARRICNSVVKSFTDFTLDPAVFRAARSKLIKALEER